MNKYEIKYVDEEGCKKRNFIYVENIDDAIEKISERYNDVLEINLVKFYFVHKYLNRDKISYSLLSEFCDGLNILLKSGIPIQKALQILKTQSKNNKYKEKLNLIEYNILEGNSLSYSLKEVDMPSFMCNLVLVGETSGKLESTLQLLYEYYYEKSKMKEIIKSATYYPSMVLVAMMFAIWICVVNVIPNYVNIFQSNNQELPAVTKILFNISKFFMNNSSELLILFILLSFIVIIFFNSLIGRRVLDYLKLNFKLFGNMYVNEVNYNFCICMYMLLNSSIDIIKSLNIVKNVINNDIVGIHIEEIKRNLENGMTLSYCLKDYNEFDTLLISLCKIGEETGTLTDSFYKCSKVYKSNIQNFLNKLERKIEIVVTIVLGVLVGFIMLSIMLPAYSVINTI